MTFYRNYESKEDIFSKHLDEIFETYKSDDTTANLEGHYWDEAHMVHYFNYIYEYRDFLNGMIKCGFDVMFLNKLNNYILEKWGNAEDKYRLVAFTGALYNMFLFWSQNNYAEDKMILISKIVSLFGKKKSVL